MWAWCDRTTISAISSERRRQLMPYEWNAGNIPVLVLQAGSSSGLNAAIGRWRARLPEGSEAPLRMVTDELFNEVRFENV
jgi:hypothetical protein